MIAAKKIAPKQLTVKRANEWVISVMLHAIQYKEEEEKKQTY